MLVMLYATRIVLQSLGVVDYGIYNVVAGSIAILGFFRNSLAVTMQRFLNHYQGAGNIEKQRQVFNIGIIYHWAIALLLLLLFLILGFFLINGILNIPEERNVAAKIVYACLIVNTFLTVVTAPYDATITAHENMLFYSLVGITESLMKLIVAIAIVYVKGDKLVIYAIMMMGIPLLETLSMRIYCKLKYEECSFHPKRNFNLPLAKQMITFASWSLLGSTTNMISCHGANLALNHFFGAAINAVAGIANQIQGLLAVVFTNLMKSLTPVIFKTEGAGNAKNMLEYSLAGCKYSTLLFAFLAIPVFIQTPYLLKIWLVDVPEWTVLFVRLQLVRALIEQLGASLQTSLNASNNIKEINLLSVFYNLAPLIILVILYGLGFQPYWHFVIMISVMVMGQNAIMIYFCHKYCGLRYEDYGRKVLLPMLVVTIVSYFCGIIPTYFAEGFLQFVSCSLFSTTISAILAYKMMEDHERKRIVGALHLLHFANN